MDFMEQIERAYKKLKASVYFDKTQAILRNQIVRFESEGINKIEQEFFELSNILSSSDEEWGTYEQTLISSIGVLSFPKKLEVKNNSVIANDSQMNFCVKDNQYYIEMDVIGHLLGILWIMYIGKYMDAEFYECSYGNRLHEKLISEETGKPKFSNNLFKPYFTQYESWRDYALEKAQEHLKESKDVIIITMDFMRFFYSVNFDETRFEEYLNLYYQKSEDDSNSEQAIILARINKFVFKVLKRYSQLLKDESKDRTILPIGFLPSNILSNDYLKCFDSAIITRWNPLYYGRYVDDIIIVDKIEKVSEIYKLSVNNELSQRNVIDYYMCRCNADKISSCPRESYLIYGNMQNRTNTTNTNDTKNSNDLNEYHVNNTILGDDKGNLKVQFDKVKIFYFKHNHSDALLSKFKQEIEQNKSEFRYLPEDDNILEQGDYSEIYNLQYKDTINKLSGVTGVTVNKYALSKFLGKYLRVGGLIDDKKESKFVNDILKIFDYKVILESYTLWEKVIEILVINNNFSILNKFIEQILKSFINTENMSDEMKLSLLKMLYAGICRSFSLNWGKNIKKCLEKICDAVGKLKFEQTETVLEEFIYDDILKLRQSYCTSRMVDKNAMPTLIDLIIESKHLNLFSDEKNINLTVFREFIEYIDSFEYDNINYYYYPYVITPQDLQFSSVILDIRNKDNIRNPKLILHLVNTYYMRLNFRIYDSNCKINEIDANLLKEYAITKTQDNDDDESHICEYAIKVGNNKTSKEKINVALANVRLNDKDFIDVLINKPNRSYERYKNIASVVKEAIANHADMLVLPESYLPIEVIPSLMAVSAKNQMAIITGIEHVVSGNQVYNLTATILPFVHEDYKFAYVNLHNKVVFSPDEKFTIEGYRYKCHQGKTYELFVWNDVWFPVYCCFEIAAIRTRAMFQSIADLIVTVEWNHDINYYSNIIESLNRDLHCYCLQVNTSDYGDSRLIKPSKTENKDIIKIKGGFNSTAIIDQINIKELRDFQIKEYGLQKLDKTFKPTPPFFSPDIVNEKRHGTLWDNINNWGLFKE